MTDVPAFADPRLWIVTSCGERDYLYGNPHTYPGRIAAFCPHEDRGYSVSKDEISDMSAESAIWIDGFLHGNEPPCPVGENGLEVEDEDPRFGEWREATERFRATGHWPEVAADQMTVSAEGALVTGADDEGSRFVRVRSSEDYTEGLIVVRRWDDGSVTLLVARNAPKMGESRAIVSLDTVAARAVIAAMTAFVPTESDVNE